MDTEGEGLIRLHDADGSHSEGTDTEGTKTPSFGFVQPMSIKPANFKCAVEGCDVTFSRSADEERHRNEIHGPSRQCGVPNCSYTYKRYPRFKQHLWKVHNTYIPPGISNWTCCRCNSISEQKFFTGFCSDHTCNHFHCSSCSLVLSTVKTTPEFSGKITEDQDVTDELPISEDLVRGRDDTPRRSFISPPLIIHPGSPKGVELPSQTIPFISNYPNYSIRSMSPILESDRVYKFRAFDSDNFEGTYKYKAGVKVINHNRSRMENRRDYEETSEKEHRAERRQATERTLAAQRTLPASKGKRRDSSSSFRINESYQAERSPRNKKLSISSIITSKTPAQPQKIYAGSPSNETPSIGDDSPLRGHGCHQNPPSGGPLPSQYAQPMNPPFQQSLTATTSLSVGSATYNGKTSSRPRHTFDATLPSEWTAYEGYENKHQDSLSSEEAETLPVHRLNHRKIDPAGTIYEEFIEATNVQSSANLDGNEIHVTIPFSSSILPGTSQLWREKIGDEASPDRKFWAMKESIGTTQIRTVVNTEKGSLSPNIGQEHNPTNNDELAMSDILEAEKVGSSAQKMRVDIPLSDNTFDLPVSEHLDSNEIPHIIDTVPLNINTRMALGDLVTLDSEDKGEEENLPTTLFEGKVQSGLRLSHQDHLDDISPRFSPEKWTTDDGYGTDPRAALRMDLDSARQSRYPVKLTEASKKYNETPREQSDEIHFPSQLFTPQQFASQAPNLSFGQSTTDKIYSCDRGDKCSMGCLDHPYNNARQEFIISSMDIIQKDENYANSNQLTNMFPALKTPVSDDIDLRVTLAESPIDLRRNDKRRKEPTKDESNENLEAVLSEDSKTEYPTDIDSWSNVEDPDVERDRKRVGIFPTKGVTQASKKQDIPRVEMILERLRSPESREYLLDTEIKLVEFIDDQTTPELRLPFIDMNNVLLLCQIADYYGISYRLNQLGCVLFIRDSSINQKPAPLITLLDRIEEGAGAGEMNDMELEREQPIRLLHFLMYDGNKITRERRLRGYEVQKFSPEIESVAGDLITAAAYVDQAIQSELQGRYRKAINEYNQACRFLRGFIGVLDSHGDKYTMDIRAIRNIIHIYSSRVDQINSLAIAEEHRPVTLDENVDNESKTSGFCGTASLASITDSVFSMLSVSSMSSAMAAGSQGAVERLVSCFLGDIEIKPLCAEGLSCIAPARFENNLRRLLKEFAVALRIEADTAKHRQTANFVRYRSRNTAHIICNKLNKALVLPETIVCQLPTTRTPMLENKEQDQGEISESSDSEPDEDSNDNLLHLEVFILNSAAIKLFRERLRNFVRPPLQKSKLKEPESDKTVSSPSLLACEFEFAEFPEVLDVLDIKEDVGSITTAKSGGELTDRGFLSLITLFFSRRTNDTSDTFWNSLLDNAFQANTIFANVLHARDAIPSLLWHIRKQFGNLMKQGVFFVQTKIKPQLPGYMPPVKLGQTRIELTCQCGQKIIDDYTEQTQGGIARFRESMHNSTPEVNRIDYLKGMLSRVLGKFPVRIIFDFSVRPEESRGKTGFRFFIHMIRIFGFTALGIYIHLMNQWQDSESWSCGDREWFKYRVGLVCLTIIGLVTLEFYLRTFPGSVATTPPIDEIETKNKSQNPPTVSTSSSEASTSSGSSLGTMVNSLRETLNFKSKKITDSERGLPLHTLPTPNPTTGNLIPDPALLPPPELLFLLLCYSSGSYATRLLQLNLHSLNAKCDQSLFTLIRTNYLSMRTVFSFKRLQSIKFVQFEMYQSELVDVRKTDDVPPPGHVDYRYKPTPLDVVPPIGENMMMHLYTNPTHASHFPDLHARFPKKLHSRVEYRPGFGMQPSWGLQYVESWYLSKVWIILFVIFGGGSLLWGIMWSIYRESIQDGFAVSAFVVAMVGVFGGPTLALLVLS